MNEKKDSGLKLISTMSEKDKEKFYDFQTKAIRKKSRKPRTYFLNGGLVEEEIYVRYLESTIRIIVQQVEAGLIDLHFKGDSTSKSTKEILNETMLNMEKNFKRKIIEIACAKT